MFYESDLKYIAKEIAALQKNYDICAKFVIGEQGEGYVCLGVSDRYKEKYFVPNPKLIPKILCDQAFYPGYVYPYQTIFQVSEDNYLKDFLNIAQTARRLEGIKHAYKWYNDTRIPERIDPENANDILDVYEKYINNWFPDDKIKFQALLVTFIKKTQEKVTSKWENYKQTVQYDTTNGKLKNRIKFLFHENLAHVSSKYIHERFDDVEHIYVKDSDYQKIERWFSVNPVRFVYSADKIFHDYKQDMFKKQKNNPWELNEQNEDIWRISIPSVMKMKYDEVYNRIYCDGAVFENSSTMFETAPIYVCQLPKSQWSYWQQCAEMENIIYSIDYEHHFSGADFDSIPIIVYEKDYERINYILKRIVDVYLESHIEIPEKDQFSIDGFVFRNGQKLSEEESKIIQRHFRKVGNK